MKILPKLIQNMLGEQGFFSSNLFWSILIGFVLIIYSVRKNVTGIGSAAKVGVYAISVFLILIIIDLITSSLYNDMVYEFDLSFINLDLNSDFFTCVACIILSFSFHPYALSIFE